MSVRRVAALALALACLSLSACAATVSGHPVTAPGTPSTTATAPGTLGDLLIAGPSGSHPWGTAWASDQLPTTDEFTARVYADADRATESARLRAQGVIAIAHRTWVASDSNQADVVLLQFDSADGATSRLRGVVSAKAATQNIQSFTVPNLPDVIGYYDAVIDEDGNYRAIVYGRKSAIVMELFYYCPAPFSTADAISWATAQLQRLH
jgi:hypothetical protein